MAKLTNTLYDKLECPVCLDYLQIPIRQCVIGHSFCTKCIDPNSIKKCPECRSNILDTRNYKLEELIETLNFPCENKAAGCNYMLNKSLMKAHTLDCRYRIFKCEGTQFCNWKCNWEGRDLLEHFKLTHTQHSTMEYATQASVAYPSTNFVDIQLIAAHHQLFWYKHKVDVGKAKMFWAFQLIGLKMQAQYYYYEFEISSISRPIRKYKITEYCHNDLDDIDEIFASEKCAAISLHALKNYVDEKQEYTFRFRIMKLKKEDTSKPSKPVPYARKIDTKVNTPYKGKYRQ